jgi:hypothetical protein
MIFNSDKGANKVNCWEVRPCPPDMKKSCAFAEQNKPCTIKCHFAACHSPKFKMADGLTAMMAQTSLPEPAKEGCYNCEFFIANAKSTSQS